MPVKGDVRGRNPLAQRPGRFHRLRPLGGDVVSVDTAGETPTRFHEHAAVFIRRPGRSPGLMETDLETGTLAAGTVRRLWQPIISPVPAPPPFEVSAQPTTITRTTRYSTRNFYQPSGSSDSRFLGLHTVIKQAVRSKPVSRGSGGTLGRPTLRNRMSSFGSRVPPLNPRVKAAEEV